MKHPTGATGTLDRALDASFCVQCRPFFRTSKAGSRCIYLANSCRHNAVCRLSRNAHKRLDSSQADSNDWDPECLHPRLRSAQILYHSQLPINDILSAQRTPSLPGLIEGQGHSSYPKWLLCSDLGKRSLAEVAQNFVSLRDAHS